MRTSTILLCTLTLSLASGCTLAGGHRVIIHEKERISVRFENLNASKLFYKGMNESDRDDFTDHGGMLVLGIGMGGGEAFHETAYYNAQVRMADIDRNGVITEAEAGAYLQRIDDAIEAEKAKRHEKRR